MSKTVSGDKGARLPMAGDVANIGHELDARTQLISPPPEETLHFRRTSRSTPLASVKRKRTMPQPAPEITTPNPKPRKQQKPLLESPRKHFDSPTPRRLATKSPRSENPDADFIPPSLSSASRRTRRTTPIPAYEPPSDIFTPPRVVVLTPSVSKSSKRKSKPRKSTTEPLRIYVKPEPPQIDLSLPMPPSSPTDDPLLLTSSPARPRRQLREVGVATASSSPNDIPTPGTQVFDWFAPAPGSSSSEFDMDVGEDVPAPFDYATGDDGWSSSDDDNHTVHGKLVEEGEGEYTGHFRTLSVRTKLDPPSSATRERQEEWGRPITPFPFKRISKLDLLKEVFGEDDEADMHVDQDEDEEERQVREMSLPRDDDDDPSHPIEADSAPQPPEPQTPQHYFNFDSSFESLDGGPPEEPSEQIDQSANDEEKSFDYIEADSPASDNGENNDEKQPFDSNVPANVNMVETNGEETHQEPSGETLPANDMPDDDEAEEERQVREMSLVLDEEEGDGQAIADDPVAAINDVERHQDHSPSPPLSLKQQPSSSQQSESGSYESPIVPPSLVQARRVLLETATHVGDIDSGSGFYSRRSSLSAAPFETPAALYPRVNASFTNITTTTTSTATPIISDKFKFKPKPNVAESDDTTHLAEDAADVEENDSSSEPDFDLDYGMVKITSADPHAAARAAAILKKHDYDCFTRLALSHASSKRRYSLGSTRGVLSGGITKSPGKRRRTLGSGVSVVGETVFIPGSPATTLPDLLKEAENIISGPTNNQTVPAPTFTPALARSLFSTPAPRPSVSEIAAKYKSTLAHGDRPRLWAKDEWKLLDACLTDERLRLGASYGQSESGETLAEVDRVQPEDVVTRFVGIVCDGTEAIEDWGDVWSLENLIQRVRALQNKQRKGHVAPPTTPYTPGPRLVSAKTTINAFTTTYSRRMPSMDVPDFTPLGRRALPPKRRSQLQQPQPSTILTPPTHLPPPLGPSAPFAGLDLDGETERPPRRKLPPSLLAPRYSHLLEEAVRVSESTTRVADACVVGVEATESEECADNGQDLEDGWDDKQYEGDTSAETNDVSFASTVSEPLSQCSPSPEPELQDSSRRLSTRVKGFLFSYLPTLPRATPSSAKPKPKQPGLPLPPPDVLFKTQTRGPINTPVRPPVPRPTHPKDTVHLHPAPKPSSIPMPRRQPKRLVELHPVTKEQEREKEREVVRPRRSSGGSVKDLVRGFEEMDQSTKGASGSGELRRMRSVGEWRKTAGLAGGAAVGGGRPTWRP